MRTLLVCALLLATPRLYGQARDAMAQQASNTTNTISFTARFDKNNATKDGYYVGPYVVVLDPKDAERFVPE